MTKEQQIKELRSPDEMQVAYPLILQLNPGLTAEAYMTMLREMIPNSYRMVGIFEGEACIAASGFWINTKLFSGRYIEIDNFVVDPQYRNRQVGKQLLDWILEEGKRNKCNIAVLDAYTENDKAHKFYFREGFFIRGYHFYKDLKTH